jgi:hypothetical protein
VGAGEGFGFGTGVGGTGAPDATRIDDFPITSPARAVIVAELVPVQVTRACPVWSVRSEVSERLPLEAVRSTATFGAITLPALFPAVAITSSRLPPDAGMSQLFGVRNIAATAAVAAAVGGGAGAVGDDFVQA